MSYWVGIDENGLGARLGPLVVTGVLARVSPEGERFLRRKLPKALRADLDDSKALVSTRNVALGEAWTKVALEAGGLEQPRLSNPAELARRLFLDDEATLGARCPPSSRRQCFSEAYPEVFEHDDELLERVESHARTLESRGVELLEARTVVLCTGTLNRLKTEGISRFSADLHAMERLLLHFRAKVDGPLLGTLGKVGGMSQYGKFFGPLSHRLHSVLRESAAESAYHFPDLGEVRFLRDADGKAPLVMLASLVGKYARELLTARIVRFYEKDRDYGGEKEALSPSGYHDPVTDRFAEATTRTRVRLRIAEECFERTTNEKRNASGDGDPRRPREKVPPTGTNGQTSLF